MNRENLPVLPRNGLDLERRLQGGALPESLVRDEQGSEAAVHAETEKGEAMSEFSNKLTPAQTERLAILAEEMGEALQVVGKVLRHGYESGNPLEPYVANETLLEKELGHVRFAMGMLWCAGDVSEARVIDACDKKGTSIQRWLHHATVRRTQ